MCDHDRRYGGRDYRRDFHGDFRRGDCRDMGPDGPRHRDWDRRDHRDRRDHWHHHQDRRFDGPRNDYFDGPFNFRRHFISNAEVIEVLEDYLAQLENEAQGVRELLAELNQELLQEDSEGEDQE